VGGDIASQIHCFGRLAAKTTKEKKLWQKKLKALVKLQISAGKPILHPPSARPGGHGIKPDGLAARNITPAHQPYWRIHPGRDQRLHGWIFLHFLLKTPPAAELLKKAAGVEKGSANPNRDKIAK